MIHAKVKKRDSDIEFLASKLRSLDLFKALEESELLNLAHKCEIINLTRRELLIKEGDPSNGFYFVSSGMIKLFREKSEGVKFVVRFIPPGGAFGEATIFQNDPYPVSASACVQSQVIHIPTAEIISKMKSSWDFCSQVLKVLCVRLKEQMKKVEYLTMPSVRLRFALFLDQEKVFDRALGVETISLTMSGREIASHLSTSPESISRLMTEFTENEILSLLRERSYNLNISKLHDLIEQDLSQL